MPAASVRQFLPMIELQILNSLPITRLSRSIKPRSRLATKCRMPLTVFDIKGVPGHRITLDVLRVGNSSRSGLLTKVTKVQEPRFRTVLAFVRLYFRWRIYADPERLSSR